ncbi:MAG TPA: hypothetical protein PLB10_19115 [Thiolinea sp.]|nr:hypothetical protein [Thiolinea sp.]
MTGAMTTTEIVSRLCAERGIREWDEGRREWDEGRRPERKKLNRFRLAVDDLNIIRALGERTLDGCDMKLEADDAAA